MFDQVFAPADIVIVLILVLMEGILSVDNALVLGMLARRLPKSQQSRALTWGLIGAFVFRLAAIAFIGQLLQWHWAKLLGGLYLLYVALKYFVVEAREKSEESIVESPEGGPTLVDANTGKPLAPASELAELEARTVVPIPDADETDITGPVGKKYPSFWLTIISIELTDVAFAVDSIFAAMAFIPPMPQGKSKLWVVFTGGFLGVILMRYAAVAFIKLLEKFPRFELSAYLLVTVIAGKLLAEYFFLQLNFHSLKTTEFWVFWVLMTLSFSSGFVPKKSRVEPANN